jgi:hypothetical protein
MPVGHRSRAPSGEKQGRLGDTGREAEGEREREGRREGEKDGRGHISVFVDKGERCIIAVLTLSQDATGIFTSSTFIKRKIRSRRNA